MQDPHDADDMTPARLRLVLAVAATGSFTEASLARESKISDWLTVTPTIGFGSNRGYIRDGHRGANHLATRIEALVTISERFNISGYVSYNWALESEPQRYEGDADLRDFFHGGIILTVEF